MRILILCLIITFIGSNCFAKAYYAGKEEMIKTAEVIAVVNITSVEKSEMKGRVWTYGQKATTEIEQCLKGNVAEVIEIYGMENFICARCEYKEGRFIVFLRKDGDLYVGSNWDIGIRPIQKEQVEWFKDNDTRFEMKTLPLKDVIEDIKSVLKKFEKKQEGEKPDIEK